MFFTSIVPSWVDPVAWYEIMLVLVSIMSDFIEFAAPGVPPSTPETFQLDARLLSKAASFSSNVGPSPSASSPSASEGHG